MKDDQEKIPEDQADFIPEIKKDPITGEMIDLQTGRPVRQTYKQPPWEPSSEFQG